VTNELSYLNEEPTRHFRSLENPEEDSHPLLTRREPGACERFTLEHGRSRSNHALFGA